MPNSADYRNAGSALLASEAAESWMKGLNAPENGNFGVQFSFSWGGSVTGANELRATMTEVINGQFLQIADDALGILKNRAEQAVAKCK